MNKSLLTLSGLALLTILATSGIKKVTYSGGITGQATAGCTCHSSKKGTITITGIAAKVVKGKTYPITLSYNCTKTTYNAFGLDIIANSGTLKATDANMSLSSNEATHNSPYTGTGGVYSYPGLSWTAPATTNTAATTVINVACVGGTSGGNGYWSTGSVSTQVVSGTPVDFETVNAAWLGENKVNVSWKTATETNSDHFDIERSFNGETYSTISTIKAAGVSDHLISYSVNDLITTGNSSAYYRIKDVDKDGAVTYSDIKEVNVKPTKSFVKTLFPNPVTGGQAINLQYVALENGKVNIELYNCLGKKMNSLTTDAVYGENNIKFNLGRFVSPGIYYIVVNNGIEKIAQLPVSVQ